MMKTMAQQVDHYHRHPPSCLGGFTAQAIIPAHFGVVGHGVSGRFPDQLVQNPNVFFQIRCQCGSDRFFVLGQAMHHEIERYETLLLAESYSLTCASCRKVTPLFDSAQYGYDAEVARMENDTKYGRQGEPELTGGLQTAIYACTKCASDTVRVEVRLEYPDDLFDDPVFAGKEQEFFSWIVIVAHCSNCSTENFVADVECA